jgi:hypothetical protein
MTSCRGVQPDFIHHSGMHLPQLEHLHTWHGCCRPVLRMHCVNEYECGMHWFLDEMSYITCAIRILT